MNITTTKLDYNYFPLTKLRTNIIVLILLSVVGIMDSFGQAGAPCNAYRWKKGGHWSGTGCAVNDGNSAPNPLGIVRCANAADAESGVNVNTTYDPTVFKIIPGGCKDPNTNSAVSITAPFAGQKISWFNFDVRPYAGIYDFQTIATGNYELEWALYYSTAYTCSTSDQDPSPVVDKQLSGNCAQISGLIACGTGFTGWSPQPFITPIFNLPTNLYLVVWKKGATNASNDNFDYTFKARFGCGEQCSLVAEGNPLITCNPNGSYTIVQNLSGSNTTVSVTAPGSTSILTNPSPLTFTTADAIPNVNTGTVTVTYPAGVNYNITMTPSGTGSYCTPVIISGTAPNCCTPSVTCPTLTPTPLNCGVIPQSGTLTKAEFLALGGGAAIVDCGLAVTVTFNDVISSTNVCSSTRTLTRTYTINIGASFTKTCDVVYSVSPALPPTFPVQSAITVACGGATTSSLTYDNGLQGACQLTGSVTSTLSTIPNNCGGDVTETWTAVVCGHTITTSRIIRVSAAALPTMSAPGDIMIPFSDVPTPTTLNFSNGLSGDCLISGTSNLSTLSGAPNPCGGKVTETWTATDICNRVIASVSRIITIKPEILTMGTCTKKDVKCYGGNTGSINAGVVSGAVGTVNYSWTNSNNVEVGNTAMVNNLPVGDYTLTIKDDCSSVKCKVTIEQPAAPLSDVTCDKIDIDCNNPLLGGTVRVNQFKNAVGNITYSWTNASNVVVGTTPIVKNLPAGTYTLTLKDECFTRTCTVTINSPCAHLFPTSTSCCTYSNGTALELPEICYTATANSIGGSISNATPGVFFYYAKLVATSTDFIVDVLQENSLSSFKLFNIQQSNQIIIWGPNCEKVATGIEIGTSGRGTVQVKKAIVGATYVISVKYDTKTMLGSTYSGTFKPEVKYTFKSQIKPANDPFAPYSDIVGSKGSILARDCKSVFVSPGICPPPVQPLMSNNKTNYSVFEKRLSVIPNPANSIVELSFNAEMDSRSTIIISDMNGKTLRKIDYQSVIGLNSTTFNLDDLANGVYIITVKTNNQLLADRLVIMK